MKDAAWKSIAEQYSGANNDVSFNSILLYDQILSRALELPGNRVLDFGAGSGSISFPLARQEHRVVAFEPMAPMASLFEDKARHENISDLRLVRDRDEIPADGTFDIVVCLNVFDHIEDPTTEIELFWRALRPDGHLLLCIPHPLKDLGEWVKREVEGENYPEYLHYELNDYLAEGPCFKNREDNLGRVVVRNFRSHHRTISTYFNWLVSAGFRVDALREPKPEPSSAEIAPVIYSKSSRIPYFLLFECTRLPAPS